jgi:phage tail sheath protein FI
VAERAYTGIEISEHNGADHAIARAPTGITAFIGRALKGPLHTPIAVRSFAEFQAVFGGLWQPSMLAYAIEQYFEHGGREALVLRVANGGSPPTITLSAGTEALTLVGLAPGSREYLRASVDYDGITAQEPQLFNVVVQRVRDLGSELVEEQEILRRLSIEPGAPRFVADVLTESQLVRVAGRVPSRRPDRSPTAPSGAVVGYVNANPDGDDGGEITDYDVIGAADLRTGLFALKEGPRFNMLCIPPLGREHDVGVTTLLVAARICRERHALLIVDPPRSWSTANLALAGMRDWPFRSEDAVMCYPRLLVLDRLRGRYELFGCAAAVAGIFARGDESAPVWSAAENEELVLRRGARLATNVTDAERQRLAQAGINVLQIFKSAQHNAPAARTLAAGNAGASDWRFVAARRLALFITSSIENGTRWVMFEPNNSQTWQRARAQVEAFLTALDDEGAFPGAPPGEGYFAICDERINTPKTRAEGQFNVLYGYASARTGEFHSFLVSHRAGSSRTRQVSVNRIKTAGRQVELEIETALLRGLTAS